MTMTTTVRVNYPVSPKDAIDFLTVLVGGDPSTVERSERPAYFDDGTMTIANCLGQGLNAACDVRWHPDGPLPTRTKWHDEADPDDPPGCIELSFDTTYGYGRGRGYGCGDLHRWMLEELRDWLTARGANPEAAWWSAGEYADAPTSVGGYNGTLADLSTHGGNASLIISEAPTSDRGAS